MKKMRLFCFYSIVLLSFSAAFAGQYQDQIDHPTCKHCGMDRTKFAHSRMLVEYQGGEQVGTCSLHCTTRELKGTVGRASKAIRVADYYSHQLINSDDAFWVLGGDLPGVMTMRAKWAFATRESAEKFVAEHGGEIVAADRAVKAAYQDMSKDMERMRKMKAMKMKKMQKK